MVDEPIRCPLGEEVDVSFYRSTLSRRHRVTLDVSEADGLIVAHMTADQARELARRLTVAADAIDPPAGGCHRPASQRRRGRMTARMTAGEALREIDHPSDQFPNKKPWTEISQERRDGFEDRAQGCLRIAAAIRARMGEGDATGHLRAIAAFWPENRRSDELEQVAGINDGRSRGIMAAFAVKIAREFLRIPEPPK